MKPPSQIPLLLLPTDLRQRLNELRNRFRIVSLLTGVSVLAGTVGLLILAQGWSDWWVGLPWIVRAFLFVFDAALVIFLYRCHLQDALRKPPTLTDTARLVERKWPHLQQRLITAVELAEGNQKATYGSLQLVATVLEESGRQTSNLRFKDLVSLRRLGYWGSFGLLVSAGTLAIVMVTWPISLALLGRMLLLNIERPKKTLIVPLTGNMIVATGSDVVVSAKAQRIIPHQGQVIITSDEPSAKPYTLDVTADKTGTFSLTIPNAQTNFRYSFQLNDSQSADFLVKTQPAPAITRLDCVEVFPDYTKLPPRNLLPNALSLLAGSHLKIDAHTTKAVAHATLVLRGVAQPIRVTLDGIGTELQADIPVPAKSLSGFTVHLVDADGVASVEDTTYPIEIVPDHPPDVKYLEPRFRRETITLRAKLPLAFEASDDFGLTTLTLNFKLVSSPPQGANNPASPGPLGQTSFTIKPEAEGKRYDYLLDASAQVPAWREEMVVDYWIEAVDNNTVTGPGVTRTEHKQLKILTLEEKEAEINRRLARRALEIDLLSEEQTKAGNGVVEEILDDRSSPPGGTTPVTPTTR